MLAGDNLPITVGRPNVTFKPIKKLVEAKAPAPLTSKVTGTPDTPPFARGLVLDLLPPEAVLEAPKIVTADAPAAPPPAKVPAPAAVKAPPPPAPPAPESEPAALAPVEPPPPPAPPVAPTMTVVLAELQVLQESLQSVRAEVAELKALRDAEVTRARRERNRARAEEIARKLMED